MEEHLSFSSRISENLDGLTETVGTLGLRATRKNRCGAAKKRARKAKLAGAPTGYSGGGQPRSALGGQPHTLQKPSTSGGHRGRELVSAGLESPESRGNPQGPSKRQRPAGGTPEGGQAKRPKQREQLGYARAAQEGSREAVVCEDYPRSQITK
jgi:hypothetical protein